MRKPNPSNWDEFPEKESLILFAQTLLEFLFDHTIDSFKAPALNAHSLALEARTIAIDVADNRVKQGALKPVLEELIEKINACPILGKKSNSIVSAYISEIVPSKSAEEVTPALNALIGELQGKYWQSICKEISRFVHAGETDKRIIELSNIFICEAELIGFAREDIYLKAASFFAKQRPKQKKISSPSAIDDFLNFFRNAKSREFSVEFVGDKSFFEIEENLKKIGIEISSIQTRKTNSALYKQLNGDGLSTRIIVDKVKAIDASKARERAEYALQFGVDIERFFSHQHSARWNRLAIVKEKQKPITKLVRPSTEPVIRGAGTRNKFLRIKRDDFIDVFSGQIFIRSSITTLYNALQYHRAALDASTTENQLLDLWAAIEGLIPTPTDDVARITHYNNHILPSLTLSYVEKIFSYLDACIREEIPEAIRIIDSETTYENSFIRTMAVLVCEDLQGARDRMAVMLSHNPLLYMLAKRAHHMFSSNSSAKKSLKKHRKRVEWHLQRIYSSRNRISHTASRLPYLETLVENLHSYLDALIIGVVEAGKYTKSVISIESALKIISIHEKSYFSDLDGSEENCTKENFCNFLLGRNNLLSPLSKTFVIPD